MKLHHRPGPWLFRSADRVDDCWCAECGLGPGGSESGMGETGSLSGATPILHGIQGLRSVTHPVRNGREYEVR